MEKKLYIFRHGETELNRQKRWQGSGMDFPLTPVGLQQAEDLAGKLADRGLEIIYSSPLKRALQTAETVAALLSVPVEVRPDLRECFYGRAEGRKIADLQNEMPMIVNNWSNPQYMDLRFPDGESKREALTRVLNTLFSLEKEPFATAGVAVHGGTMGALLNHFGVAFNTIPNCGAFCLLLSGGRAKVEGGIF